MFSIRGHGTAASTIRFSGDRGAARKAILAITPDSPPYDVATLEGRLERQTWKARSEVLIVSLFAGAMVALALAALLGAVLSGRRPSRFTLASGT